MTKPTFKFYCPANLQKAKDDAGNDTMRIGGIASTMDKDSDGEYLDPNGFLVDEFLEVGLVNWHHQAKNSPITIIGEPTLAEIRPEGFYVECDLYKSSAMAKEVFDLAQILEKDSKKRRLGFSIEGSVLERASDDKKSPDYNVIKKAVITGLAITHMPKNSKTFADIIKGKIEEEEEEIEKDLSTESGSALKKESVDKDLKVLIKSKYSFIERDEESMYDTIFNTYSGITIEKAEKIYDILTKIENDMKSQKISDEQIEKAQEILGLGKPDEGNNPFIQKAKDEPADSPEDIASKMEAKTYAEGAKVSVDDDAPSDGLEKAIVETIARATNQTTQENVALGTLIKAQMDQNNRLEGLITEQKETIQKAVETIDALQSRLDSFGKQPAPRKSITKAQPVERPAFQPATASNPSETILSKSRDYDKVLNIVDAYCDSKGMRADLSKAVVEFEVTKQLPSTVVSEIKREMGINIVD